MGRGKMGPHVVCTPHSEECDIVHGPVGEAPDYPTGSYCPRIKVFFGPGFFTPFVPSPLIDSNTHTQRSATLTHC